MFSNICNRSMNSRRVQGWGPVWDRISPNVGLGHTARIGKGADRVGCLSRGATARVALCWPGQMLGDRLVGGKEQLDRARGLPIKRAAAPAAAAAAAAAAARAAVGWRALPVATSCSSLQLYLKFPKGRGSE